MESLLATEDVYGAGGGTAAGGVEGITARSLSAADEWATMSHRIDKAPAPRLRDAARTAHRLRSAPILMEMANRQTA